MGRSRVRIFRLAPAFLLPALLALATLALMPEPASAQIRINEVYANPPGATELEERVEIYNAGVTAIDVTGWAIHDAATIDGNPAPERCRIPEDFDTSTGCSGSAIIGPGEFRLVKATAAAAWINNGTEDVYLCSNRTIPATIVHQVSWVSTVEGSSWSALPNGSSNFAWRSLTLCASNGASGDVVAPAAVIDLAAVPGAFPGEIRLTWTAPGDDGGTGTATAYIMRVAHSAITGGTFDAVADIDRWIGEPLPAAGGTPETLFVFGLDPDSTWFFALKTQDEVPNTSAVSNSPGTAPLAGALPNPDLGYNAYFGNLHSHTGYSDGVQTPTDAYNYARNTAPTPLDFLAVTEHNHSTAGMSLPNYAQGMSQASAANSDGNFVAIFGQEWGLAANGHVNIFEAPVLFGWEGGNHDVFVAEGDYAGLYTAALANPPSSYPVILEWCHPATSDFDNMQVTNDGRSAVHLMCLVNGPSMSTATDESDIGNTNFDAAFNEALRKGYRVSPTGDQDNHNANWGSSSESRTGVLANTKSKSAILSAMAARRTYATQDHNAVVQFSADGHALGEAFTATQGIRIAIEVSDPDLADAIAQIDLFRGITGTSAAVRVAGSAGNATFHWRELDVFADGTEAHYYLRVRMADNQNIWTGPVYVTYDASSVVAVGDPPPMPGLRLSAHPNPTSQGLTVEFALPRDDAGSLALYDLSGRLVRTLLDGPLAAGPHTVAWDGLADDGGRPGAGIFFLRLQTGAGRVERKVLLLQ
jgi:lamin tail-like protein/flagellar hook capping protein FlgD